jgi:molybdate transport system substrate-binding protein
MKKLITAATVFIAAFALLTGCGGNSATTAQNTEREEAKQETVQESAQETVQETAQETGQETVQEPVQEEPVEIQVFIAASLNTVMQDVKAAYEAEHPNVTIVLNPDSSGKLLTQIEEGYECDVFFSAAQKQMNTLQDTDGLVVEGTRHNVVNNQVVVVSRKDSGTSVTGLADIGNAESIALADGSVPVGRYTRVAMAALGILPETEDPSVYTTQEVSDALGGVEISEQSNVSKVLAAVVEGSCEVGTTYYSDTYGYEDQLDILEKVSYDLTGNVIYPIAQVKNDQASDAQAAAAADFVEFVASDQMKPVFEGYYFDTNVE